MKIQEIYRKIDLKLQDLIDNLKWDNVRSILTPLQTETQALLFLDWIEKKDAITEEEAIKKSLDIYHEYKN